MAYVATIPISKMPIINNFISDQKNSSFTVKNKNNINDNLDLNQSQDRLQNNINNKISLSESLITSNNKFNNASFNNLKTNFNHNESKTLLPNINYSSSYSSMNRSQQQSHLSLPIPPLLSNNRNNNLLLNSSQFATHNLTTQNENALNFNSNHSFSRSSTPSSLSSIPNPSLNSNPSFSPLSYKSISRSNSENLNDKILSGNINNHTHSHNAYSLPSLNLVLNKIQESQPISLPLPTSSLQSFSSPSPLSSFHSNYNNNNNNNNLALNNHHRIPSLNYNHNLINKNHLDQNFNINNRLPSIPPNLLVNTTTNVMTNENNINKSNLILEHEILLSPSSSSSSSLLIKDKILINKSNNNSEINDLKAKNKNANLNENSNDNLINDDNSTINTRKYKCKICNKGFTTSGHLARHHRIHTGVKNHECPFEGCNSRFSRQDNCMQHYKTHLKGKKSRKRCK